MQHCTSIAFWINFISFECRSGGSTFEGDLLLGDLLLRGSTFMGRLRCCAAGATFKGTYFQEIYF